MSGRSPILDSTAPVAPYIPGSNPYLLRTESSAFGRTLLIASNAAAARALLDLEIGTDVQAYHANLDSLSLQTIAPFGRDLLGKANAAAVRSYIGAGVENTLTFSSPLSRVAQDISIPQASGSTDGYLSSGYFGLFNSKESALVFDPPLMRTVNNIVLRIANGSQSGGISAADWTTFNNKQPAGSYAASGPNNDITSLSAADIIVAPPDTPMSIRGGQHVAPGPVALDGASVRADPADSSGNADILLRTQGTGRVLVGSDERPIDRLPEYTVAGLPASPTRGDRVLVTDSSVAVFGDTVAGSGILTVPVYYNGTHWKVG